MSLRIKFLEFSEKLVAIFLEACHHAGRHNVIIKFSKRKDCQQIFAVKKGLSKLDMREVELPERTHVFVNQSLCPLWSKIKKLSSLGIIHSFFISNSTIKIKLKENSNPESNIHRSDLDKFFPDVDLSLSNLYIQLINY